MSFTIYKCHAHRVNVSNHWIMCPPISPPKSFYSRLGYWFPKGHPRIQNSPVQLLIPLSTPQIRYLLLLDSQENFSNKLIIERTSYSRMTVLLTRLVYEVSLWLPNLIKANQKQGMESGNRRRKRRRAEEERGGERRNREKKTGNERTG